MVLHDCSHTVLEQFEQHVIQMARHINDPDLTAAVKF